MTGRQAAACALASVLAVAAVAIMTLIEMRVSQLISDWLGWSA